MKKRSYLIAAASVILFACNNEAGDSVEKADSINAEKMDTSSTTGTTPEAPITTDKESTDFLVAAANSGMAEVNSSKLAQSKATNQSVKDFASMLVRDHSGANEKVKALSIRRNVTLPDSVSNDKKKDYDDLNKKAANDFDKAYIKEMVNGHQASIDRFEKASKNVQDTEVKTFVDATLPTLRQHLDSAKAIQKRLK